MGSVSSSSWTTAWVCRRGHTCVGPSPMWETWMRKPQSPSFNNSFKYLDPSYDLAIPLPGIYPNKRKSAHKVYLYLCINCSSIHCSQDMKWSQISHNWWLHKEYVINVSIYLTISISIIYIYASIYIHIYYGKWISYIYTQKEILLCNKIATIEFIWLAEGLQPPKKKKFGFYDVC